MKSLIVFSSQTGNTKRLAWAVYDTLPESKEILPVTGAPQPEGYDLVAVGFRLQGGRPDPEILQYLPKIGSQKVLLFATHAAAKNSEHACQALTEAANLLPEASIVGTFGCQGEVEPGFLEKARTRQPPPAWLQDADSAKGHPNQTDLDELKKMVAAILKSEFGLEPNRMDPANAGVY